MSARAPLPKYHLVGFTGHRVLAEPEQVARAIGDVLRGLRAEGVGEWVAVSSAAAGADLLFAEEALAQGLGWEAWVPLPLVEFRKDFGAEEWAVAERLLAKAEVVTVIGEEGTREDAYWDAGMETVNGCDVLIAVWDGKAARGKGGTAEVVAYARAAGRPLVLIDSETGEVRREGWKRFLGDTAEGDFLDRLPEATGAAVTGPTDTPVAWAGWLRRADEAATRGAPHFRRLTATVVGLHAGATLAAAAALAFGLHWPVLPWLKLAGVAGAFVVAIVIRRYRTQDRWVRCRLAAELTRSALATWGMRRGLGLFRELEAADMRRLTRALEIEQRRAAASRPMELELFKARYLAERLDDQRAYYARQLARALPQLGWLKRGFSTATLLAILFTAGYAVDHTWHLGWLHGAAEAWAYYYLPIALPVVAAGLMALIAINDLHRRVARYREMEHVLEAARRQLGFAQTWGSVERIVGRTERALLQEVVEWRTLASHLEAH